MFNKIKSPETLFNKTFHTEKFMLLNKNILYLTHTMDKCLLVLKKLEVENGLQKQVDEYFDDESHQNTPPSSTPEDSKQRENGN